MDVDRLLREITTAATACGFTREEIARDPVGSVDAWTRGDSGPAIYLSAGIHGDEPAGPLALLELLRGNGFAAACQWALCPVLNPAGLAAGTRDNAEGIDLNRDYRKRRSTVTRAHADWLQARPVPDLFLSLHEDWETSGFYFYEINLGADDPRRAHAILAATSPWLPPEPNTSIDDHVVREPGWIYHPAEADMPDHWPEAIFLAKLGCPLSFTFETPSSAPPDKRVATLVAAVRACLPPPAMI